MSQIITEVTWTWPSDESTMQRRSELVESGLDFCETCLTEVEPEGGWMALTVAPHEPEPPDFFCCFACLAVFATACSDDDEKPDLRDGTSIVRRST